MKSICFTYLHIYVAFTIYVTFGKWYILRKGINIISIPSGGLCFTYNETKWKVSLFSGQTNYPTRRSETSNRKIFANGCKLLGIRVFDVCSRTKTELVVIKYFCGRWKQTSMLMPIPLQCRSEVAIAACRNNKLLIEWGYCGNVGLSEVGKRKPSFKKQWVMVGRCTKWKFQVLKQTLIN